MTKTAHAHLPQNPWMHVSLVHHKRRGFFWPFEDVVFGCQWIMNFLICLDGQQPLVGFPSRPMLHLHLRGSRINRF